MPNWCYNVFAVFGPRGDVREFQALTAAHDVDYGDDFLTEQGEPVTGWVPLSFDALAPLPENLPCDEAAEWQRTHWGTQWDLTPATKVIEDVECVSYDFDTAWTPPIGWVASVAAQYPWLTFLLAYLEPDMALAGLVFCQEGEIRKHRTFDGDDAHISELGVRYFGFDPYGDGDGLTVGGG